MRSAKRVIALLTVAAVFAGAGPAAAGNGVVTTAHQVLAASGAQATITASPPPCEDTRYNLQGPRWMSTLNWRFKASTTPAYLNAADVVAVLRLGFTNITRQRNDCGLADLVSATQSYQGVTSNAIGVTKAGNCGSSDGANTLGFGALPSGVLALTCVRSIGGEIIESDIRFSNQVSWALSLAACASDYMLEAVVTHEAGHAYGLGHVGEPKHGRLTMSTYIDGLCNNQESSLGNGDVRGLRALY